MGRNTSRRVAAAAAAALCLLAPAGPAPARPYGIEDFLRREAIGAVQAAPGGRWLVVEWRGPRLASRRFDNDLLNPLFRTTVMVADLARPGALRPLFAPEPGAGYMAGPFSPDGARLAVQRLKDDQVSLGVAELATGRVRWLDVHPDLTQDARCLDWISPTELVAIARLDGTPPWFVRAMHPWRQLPARWEAAAAGGQAATTYGTGAFARDNRREAPMALLRVDAVSGASRTVARGDFADLEVSPSRRHVAVLERTEAVRWTAGAQVQGDYGVATHRQRIRIYATGDGRVTRPCESCDILGGLMSWSRAPDRLLLFTRRDGDPWPAGRLLQVDAGTGALGDPARGRVTPHLERRPEAVLAAWWGDVPLVFGRPSGDAAARDDWRLLTPGGPRVLTAALARAPAQISLAGPDRLMAKADGRVVAIDRRGRAAFLPAGADLLRAAQHGFHSRMWHAPGDGRSAALAWRTDRSLRLRPVSAASAARDAEVPAGAEVLQLVPERGGAVVLERLGGAAQRLLWSEPGRAPRVLGLLNAAGADLEAPEYRRVLHPGPSGEPRASWLLLPKRPPGAPPPPLVVWPYPGAVQTAKPASLDLTDDVSTKQPLVLAGHGYAVLLPSLPTVHGGPGPAEGLADQVLRIVDAAAAQPDLAGAFDPARLGLAGFSHGGYAVNAIVTQTGRFRAAVSMGGSSSLSSMWGVLNAEHRVNPEARGPGAAWMAAWAESVQGNMYAPPWAGPDRYVRNSPLFHAGEITTPLLLMQGEQDSQPLAEAERMFSALDRQGKDGELVTYWGEGHVLSSPGNLRDYSRRMLDWLDRALAP